MFTKAQQKVIDVLTQNETVLDHVIEKDFHGKTINALLEKGHIKKITQSRLRQDDMEMVYWHEYCLVK